MSRYGGASGMFKTARTLQIDAPIKGGNSGGVLFNAGGAVGMLSFGKSRINQAVQIGRVLDVADELQRSRLSSDQERTPGAHQGGTFPPFVNVHGFDRGICAV